MNYWTTFDSFWRAWWQPGVAGLIALVIGYLAYRIATPIVMRVARHSRVASAVLARMQSKLRWLLPLIALQIAWQGVPDAVPGIDSVRHFTGILLIAAFTMTAIAAVRGVVDAVALLNPQDVADNLEARRIMTQTRVLSRIVMGALMFAGLSFILMTFPTARQVGTSLLASAGLSALVIGIAARSVFSNMLAGLQIALSQPIRIDDVLIVENEWGRVEEITGTYVVLKIWDERRLVIPLQWFIEHPFQNWTRTTSQIIGSVFFWVDYTTDLASMRAEATRLAQGSKDYDGRVCLLQVTDTNERAMQLRLIVSSPSAGQSWDLRCLLREGLIDFLQRTQPQSLPRVRAEMAAMGGSLMPAAGGPMPALGSPAMDAALAGGAPAAPAAPSAVSAALPRSTGTLPASVEVPPGTAGAPPTPSP